MRKLWTAAAICVATEASFFVSTSVLADMSPIPSALDGGCSCSLSCSAAFKSTAADDLSTTNGTYTLSFKSDNTAGITSPSDEATKSCVSAAETKLGLPSIQRDATIKDLVVRFCVNGGPDIGACSASAECSLDKVECVVPR